MASPRDRALWAEAPETGLRGCPGPWSPGVLLPGWLQGTWARALSLPGWRPWQGVYREHLASGRRRWAAGWAGGARGRAVAVPQPPASSSRSPSRRESPSWSCGPGARVPHVSPGVRHRPIQPKQRWVGTEGPSRAPPWSRAQCELRGLLGPRAQPHLQVMPPQAGAGGRAVCWAGRVGVTRSEPASQATLWAERMSCRQPVAQAEVRDEHGCPRQGVCRGWEQGPSLRDAGVGAAGGGPGGTRGEACPQALSLPAPWGPDVPCAGSSPPTPGLLDTSPCLPPPQRTAALPLAGVRAGGRGRCPCAVSAPRFSGNSCREAGGSPLGAGQWRETWALL